LEEILESVLEGMLRGSFCGCDKKCDKMVFFKTFYIIIFFYILGFKKTVTTVTARTFRWNCNVLSTQHFVTKLSQCDSFLSHFPKFEHATLKFEHATFFDELYFCHISNKVVCLISKCCVFKLSQVSCSNPKSFVFKSEKFRVQIRKVSCSNPKSFVFKPSQVTSKTRLRRPTR